MASNKEIRDFRDELDRHHDRGIGKRKPVEYAELARAVGQHYFQLSNYSLAVKYHRVELEYREECRPQETARIAYAHSDIALSLAKLLKTNQALSHMKKFQQLGEVWKDHVLLYKALLNKGYVYQFTAQEYDNKRNDWQNEQDREKALKYFRKSLKYFDAHVNVGQKNIFEDSSQRTIDIDDKTTLRNQIQYAICEVLRELERDEDALKEYKDLFENCNLRDDNIQLKMHAAYGAFLCDLKKFKRAEIVLTANLRILKNLKFPDGGFAFEGLCVLELQRRNFRAALDYAQQFEDVAKKKRHHENAAKAALRQQEARDGIKAQKRASVLVSQLDRMSRDDCSDRRIAMLTELSGLYLNLELFNDAIVYLQEREEILKSKATSSSSAELTEQLTNLYRDMADARLCLKEFEEAGQAFGKAIALYEPNDDLSTDLASDHLNVGNCYLSLANALLSKEAEQDARERHFKRATKSFNTSVAMSRKYSDGNESFLLQALSGLAEVHFRTGDSKKGEEYAGRAKELWGVVEEQELKAQDENTPPTSSNVMIDSDSSDSDSSPLSPTSSSGRKRRRRSRSRESRSPPAALVSPSRLLKKHRATASSKSRKPPSRSSEKRKRSSLSIVTDSDGDESDGGFIVNADPEPAPSKKQRSRDSLLDFAAHFRFGGDPSSSSAGRKASTSRPKPKVPRSTESRAGPLKSAFQSSSSSSSSSIPKKKRAPSDPWSDVLSSSSLSSRRKSAPLSRTSATSSSRTFHRDGSRSNKINPKIPSPNVVGGRRRPQKNARLHRGSLAASSSMPSRPPTGPTVVTFNAPRRPGSTWAPGSFSRRNGPPPSNSSAATSSKSRNPSPFNVVSAAQPRTFSRPIASYNPGSPSLTQQARFVSGVQSDYHSLPEHPPDIPTASEQPSAFAATQVASQQHPPPASPVPSTSAPTPLQLPPPSSPCLSSASRPLPAVDCAPQLTQEEKDKLQQRQARQLAAKTRQKDLWRKTLSDRLHLESSSFTLKDRELETLYQERSSASKGAKTTAVVQWRVRESPPGIAKDGARKNERWRAIDADASAEIEKIFQQQNVCSFIPKGGYYGRTSHSYVIDLEGFTQRNRVTGVQRLLERVETSPPIRFVLGWVLEKWKKTASPTASIIPLSPSPTDPEKLEIRRLFMEKLPRAEILRIERVQNPRLAQRYVNTYVEMALRPNRPKPVEKLLFHGARHHAVEGIVEEGFDLRLAGGNGERYGKGIYFSKSSQYSKNFAQAEPTPRCSTTSSALGQTMYSSRQPFRKMIVARVLVGDCCKGDKAYVRPPRIDEHRKELGYFDNCVDSLSHPSIFVTFDSSMALPCYVVNFVDNS